MWLDHLTISVPPRIEPLEQAEQVAGTLETLTPDFYF
jgi:hypothetical protein